MLTLHHAVVIPLWCLTLPLLGCLYPRHAITRAVVWRGVGNRMSLHLSISILNMGETETVQQKLIYLCREMQHPPQLLQKFVNQFFVHTARVTKPQCFSLNSHIASVIPSSYHCKRHCISAAEKLRCFVNPSSYCRHTFVMSKTLLVKTLVPSSHYTRAVVWRGVGHGMSLHISISVPNMCETETV